MNQFPIVLPYLNRLYLTILQYDNKFWGIFPKRIISHGYKEKKSESYQRRQWMGGGGEQING